MPEKRTIYVSVDSKAFGRAWGLSLFIKFFPYIIFLSIIIGIILGVMWVIQSASLFKKYGTIDQKAIATLEFQREQDNIISKLQQIGTININNVEGEYPAGEFIRVERAEFRDQHIVIFFESNTGAARWDESCIAWYDIKNHLDRNQKIIDQQVTILDNNHVKGYLVFPDSIVTTGSGYWFSFGCSSGIQKATLWTWDDLGYDIRLP